MRADKAMQLAVTNPISIGCRDNIGVIQFSIVGTFNEPRSEGKVILAGPLLQPFCCRPVGNRLSELLEFFLGQIAEMPVTRDAAFWKTNKLDIALRGGDNKTPHGCKIGLFVAWRVLKLYASHSESFHV